MATPWNLCIGNTTRFPQNLFSKMKSLNKRPPRPPHPHWKTPPPQEPLFRLLVLVSLSPPLICVLATRCPFSWGPLWTNMCSPCAVLLRADPLPLLSLSSPNAPRNTSLVRRRNSLTFLNRDAPIEPPPAQRQQCQSCVR